MYTETYHRFLLFSDSNGYHAFNKYQERTRNYENLKELKTAIDTHEVEYIEQPIKRGGYIYANHKFLGA